MNCYSLSETNRGLVARTERARAGDRARRPALHRSTFFWLLENSVGFNRFLVGQLNERLGQFIASVEYGRTLDATARLARSIASFFNPILYPDLTRHMEITQEEIGAPVRYLPAKCQPVPEETGEAGVIGE
jgi:hypothetical protein